MKIAVLTLPLLNNYGGNLQAFAMMEMLKNLGHEPVFVNLKNKMDIKFWIKYFLKRYFLFFMDRYKNPTKLIQNPDFKKFNDTHINPKTNEIFTNNELHNYFKNHNFDAVILGSDQVFRPEYFGDYKNDFSLGFISDDTMKISYAASFGSDKYSGDNVEFHSLNLKKFKAISVREKSGIKTCKDVFNVDAVHVLDPTMMIEVNEYEELFKDIKNSSTKGKIFAYILDKNSKKDELLKNLAQNREIYEINDGNSHPNIISLEEWLKNIYDADLVITDSFHGCVFSILFNKPFYAFVNESRGADRFYSLFEMFDLNDRIIKDSKFTHKDIDYDKINKILEKQKTFSKEFLVSNLKVKCDE